MSSIEIKRLEEISLMSYGCPQSLLDIMTFPTFCLISHQPKRDQIIVPLETKSAPASLLLPHKPSTEGAE